MRHEGGEHPELQRIAERLGRSIPDLQRAVAAFGVSAEDAARHFGELLRRAGTIQWLPRTPGERSAALALLPEVQRLRNLSRPGGRRARRLFRRLDRMSARWGAEGEDLARH